MSNALEIKNNNRHPHPKSNTQDYTADDCREELKLRDKVKELLKKQKEKTDETTE